MTAEQLVCTALEAVLPDAVYPEVAPGRTPAPWITYQAVGGQSWATLDGSPQESLNQRIQIAVWAPTRMQAGAIMAQVYQALVAAPVYGVPIGAPVSTFEEDTKLRGSTLDFSITYKVS